MGVAAFSPRAPSQPEKREEMLTKEDLTNCRKSALLFFQFSADGQAVLSPQVSALVEGDENLTAHLQSIGKTIPRKDNPTEIADFNYCYKDGKLCNIDTGKPFHWVNQKHYDALGDTVVRHIQSLLVKDYGLQEIQLPLDPEYKGPTNNIFVSPDWKTSEKLMLLIQGSGAVRPGQWARALCINENLEIGTIFPYLERCKKEGYAVIVFNPNQNKGPVTPVDVLWKDFISTEPSKANKVEYALIPDNETNAMHTIYVWDNFASKSEAKIILSVSHSAGGYCTQALLEKREDAMEKIAGVAFTDSVHMPSKATAHFIQKRCRNWVTSDDPLDTPQRKMKGDCLCVSAGHDTHEYTSGVAINSVFDFLLHRAAVFPTEDLADTNYDKMPKKPKTK